MIEIMIAVLVQQLIFLRFVANHRPIFVSERSQNVKFSPAREKTQMFLEGKII